MEWLKFTLLLIPLCLAAEPRARTRLFNADLPFTGSMNAVAADASGNIFAAGAVGSSIIVSKVKPDFEPAFVAEINVGGFSLQVNALALEPAGNAWIIGATDSRSFPVTEDAYQHTIHCGSPCATDTFLAKVDGSTGALLYATYLGGSVADAATSVGIGPDGTVYVGGVTYSADFPVSEGALVDRLPTAPAGFAARFSADGKTLIASTFIKGAVSALAIGASGEVYLAGQTSDPKPGTVGAFQQETRLVSLMASADNGDTWRNLTAPARVFWLEPDPATSGVLYAGTSTGLYRSEDDGVTWETVGEVPFASALVRQVRIDRAVPSTMYVIAGTEPVGPPVTTPADALWKSGDGGRTWTRTTKAVNVKLQLHGQDSAVLYLTATDTGATEISRDGGLTWDVARVLSPRGLAVDTANGDNLYVGSSNTLQLRISHDAGRTWTTIADGFANRPPLSITPLFASGLNLLYASPALNARAGGVISGSGMRQSQDGGAIWSTVSLDVPAAAAFSDPRDVRRVYVTGPGGLYASRDTGGTWTSLRGGMDNPNVTQVSVGTSGELYATATPQPGGFLLKLDADLASVGFCTAYGGSGGTSPKSLVLDRDGRPVIAGMTTSRDLPVTAGAAVGFEDGFIARFSNDGAQLEFASFIGGIGNDSMTAVAMTPEGTAWLAGSTVSKDYPLTADTLQTEMRGSSWSGAVTAVTPEGKIGYSTFLGGSWLDRLNAITLRGTKVYLAGSVGSSDFPGLGTSAPSPLPAAALVEIDFGGR